MPDQVGGDFWQWLLVCFDQVDLVHHLHVGGIAVVRVGCVHV